MLCFICSQASVWTVGISTVYHTQRLMAATSLTKWCHCDDYGPALNSTWLYLERDSEPSVTNLSVWRLLVHGTVFQPVSLQQLLWLPSKYNWRGCVSVGVWRHLCFNRHSTVNCQPCTLTAFQPDYVKCPCNNFIKHHFNQYFVNNNNNNNNNNNYKSRLSCT